MHIGHLYNGMPRSPKNLNPSLYAYPLVNEKLQMFASEQTFQYLITITDVQCMMWYLESINLIKFFRLVFREIRKSRKEVLFSGCLEVL